jgi:ergothioneine biosynthesis protein EgtB
MISPHDPAQSVRHAGLAELAVALRSSRQDTLATFADFERGLHKLAVPHGETLNPPLWELGHVGWFQEFWIARNPQRNAGVNAEPGVLRAGGVRPQADALYHSSEVAHAARWALPLPSADATRADLAAQLARTLELLRQAEGDDAALYFFRLALLHEDMHHEAALGMAQSLGLPIADVRWHPAPLGERRAELAFAAGPWTVGRSGRGFAFDNELQAHVQQLPASHIDSRVLRWADYLPFVEADGYTEPRWWSDAGCTWLAAERPVAPRYTRRTGRSWQQWREGQWCELDPTWPACHLTAFEAEAWCRWAGRRLPTEAEWERAAVDQADAFEWGQVWEWTASPFEPYAGFEAHPYRDYSAPWFGSRRVLRGASFMTQPRMRDPRYRNFYAPHRNDVPAGLRSCQL